MSARAVVVVGASAGGVEALRALVAGFPVDLDAAVCVVLHIAPRSASALPQILDRAGPLPAEHATDGLPLLAGRIYVAPADYHLLVVDSRVHLSSGPTENGHRPAVDPLFRSAARAFGPAAVGVVLSGARDDGTSGLEAIVRHGGVALVQDPSDALHPSMPRSAITHVPQSRPLPMAKLGQTVGELVAAAPPALCADADPLLQSEHATAAMEPVASGAPDVPAAGFGCPACHGSLFELPGEPAPRFRCRVGHAWSPQSLLEEQAMAFEGALWMALRSLEEKAALNRRLADLALERGSNTTARHFHHAGGDAERAGGILRDLIKHLNGTHAVDVPDEPA
jgi:two-component system chemotaxis response regulator CheB